MGFHYAYDGPVMEFNRCIADRWQSETMAKTTQQARSNLTYQYKKSHNRTPTAKITLPGKITMVQ